MFRLGRKSAACKPTPLLVQLGSGMAKNIVMDSLFRLKHIEAKFRDVTIFHDMTVMARQECINLVEEAKK